VILSEADLLSTVARDRANGRTIAFANGCFDLLHVGMCDTCRAPRLRRTG